MSAGIRQQWRESMVWPSLQYRAYRRDWFFAHFDDVFLACLKRIGTTEERLAWADDVKRNPHVSSADWCEADDLQHEMTVALRAHLEEEIELPQRVFTPGSGQTLKPGSHRNNA